MRAALSPFTQVEEWVIAALQMLGTLVAIKLWLKGEQTYEGRVEAFTGHEGNNFALKKGMSTKFPVTVNTHGVERDHEEARSSGVPEVGQKGRQSGGLTLRRRT